MKHEIRQANLNDLSSVTVCVNNAFREYIPALGKKPSSMNTNFKPLIQKGEVYVIELENEVIAVMVLLKSKDHILIKSVAVRPEFQKKGLGKQLLNYAEKMTYECGFSEIRLYTGAKLPELIDYWSERGFEESETRVEDGYDRVFMIKHI